MTTSERSIDDWTEMKKSGRGWRNEFLHAFQDAASSVVEPVMNSVDSYEEKKEKTKVEEPQPIFIKYGVIGNRKSRKGYCEIKDFAMGIPPRELLERFEFHEAATSARSRGIKKGGGWKGVGVKDTLMFHAWESKTSEPARVTSFYNGRYSQILAKFDDKEEKPKLKYEIPDEEITIKDTEDYGFTKKDNGTIVKFPLGPNCQKVDFEEFKENLKRHFRLRKILSSNKFRVTVQNYYNPKETEDLVYTYPEVEEELFNDEIDIQLDNKEIEEFQRRIWELRERDKKYKEMITDEDMNLLYQGKFKAHLVIWKSTEPLNHRKTSSLREGITVYHDNYSVLDCTLFGWEGKSKLSNFLFGDLEIIDGANVLIALEDVGVPLVDKKRKGLYPENYFNQKLSEKVSDIIESIYQKYKFEPTKESLGEEKELKKALKEINDDLKNEISPEEKGVGITPPDEGLKFYETYSVSSKDSKPLNLKQLEPKGILLAVNTIKITNPDDILIEADEGIEVYVKKKLNPGTYPNLQIWHLNITGIDIAINKRATANYKEFSDAIIVNVKENEKLDYDFKLFPNDFLITLDKEKETEIKKNIFLVMKEEIFSSSRPILLNLKNNLGGVISCPVNVNTKNIRKLGKNSLIFKIPISVKYQKGVILPFHAELTAEYKIKFLSHYITNAKITIDEKGQRRPKGFIHDILPDFEKSSYDDARIESGILYLHMWHPTFNSNNLELDIESIKANAASRCLVKHLVDLKGYLGENQPAYEFIAEYDMKYEQFGKKWQEALFKSFKKKKLKNNEEES